MMKFIWENGRRNYRDPFSMLTPDAYFHDDKYPKNDVVKFNFVQTLPINVSIVVKKSSHQYMSRPFGQCHHYRTPNDLTYNAMSYIECYRKCLKRQYIKRWICVPYLIDHFITEYDVTNDVIERCSTNLNQVRNKIRQEQNFAKLCSKNCPKECFQVEYSSETKERNTFFANQKWIDSDPKSRAYERQIVWDTSEPMFAYIDEPVMTFTQYLVSCGGLMGLWFGQSLKDGFSLLINKSFWRSVYYKILLLYHFVFKNIVCMLKYIGYIVFIIIDIIPKILTIIMDNCRKILVR